MMRNFSRVAAVVLVLMPLNACNDEPLELSSGASAVSPQASVSGGPNDVAAIQQILDTFDAAWGSDPIAYAAQYAGADFIGPDGTNLTSPAAITALYTFLFTAVFGGSTRTSTIRNLTFLTGTLAVLDINAQITGFGPPGTIGRAREKNILLKRAGEWRIVQHQQTLLGAGVSF